MATISEIHGLLSRIYQIISINIYTAAIGLFYCGSMEIQFAHIIRLTHWGRVTHICVSKQTIIGSDNGLSPGRRQAIIWTNAGISLIQILGTNFNEILSEIHTFSFKNMGLKMSSAKWRLFCLGLNVLTVSASGSECSWRRRVTTNWNTSNNIINVPKPTRFWDTISCLHVY